MSDDENDSIHTPTQSEFATFEILANRDYTNMSKKKPRRKDLRGNFPVDVVEEEDEQPSRNSINEEEEDDDEQRAEPREDREDSSHDGDKKSVASSESSRSSKSHSQSVEESEKNENEKEGREDDHYKHATPPRREAFASAAFASAPASASATRPPPPAPKKKAYMESVESERRDEKEGLLTELLSLAESGQCKLVRSFTMKDSLEEISFQYDRCQSEIEARRMVNLAKSSIDVGAGLLEMVAKNFGFPLLDGYHKSLCSDMNRFDRPLTKIYKKYWRRGAQKPEMELAMIIIGSFGWTVMSNMMKDGSYLKKFFGGGKNATSKAKEEEAAAAKEKEMEAIKAKFSSTSAPPSPTNSSGAGVGMKKMRPPSASMNLTSPWTQVSSTPKIEVIDETPKENQNQNQNQNQGKSNNADIDREAASALQSLKLKEIEMDRRMERIAKMEEEMTKRVSEQQQKKKTLAELALAESDDDENEDDEDEDDEDDEEHVEPRRVVIMSSPPASGRKSGRKGGQKQPIVKL